MTAPAAGWNFVLVLNPDEIEALRAGKRVKKTYPAPLSKGPPLLLGEELEAVREGKRVTKLTDSLPGPLLQVGVVVPVISSDGPIRQPPGLLPEDLDALLAGKTLKKTWGGGAPPPRAILDLRVRVVDYRQQGDDHIYTFEPV